MDISHFVYPFIRRCIFYTFSLVAIISKAAMNIHIQVFVITYLLISFIYTLSSEIAGSHTFLCNFLRNDWTVFQSKHTIVHFHQQWMWPQISPYPCQYILFTIVFILATILGKKWYLNMVLICMSLMDNDVELLFSMLLSIHLSTWRNVYSDPSLLFSIICLFNYWTF
jgi:hypothetical protein